ncbi:conserved hypothetical protein [Oenococcus oeni]|nr:conserved hypothetical protein [Oenococcus oeni]
MEFADHFVIKFVDNYNSSGLAFFKRKYIYKLKRIMEIALRANNTIRFPRGQKNEFNRT